MSKIQLSSLHVHSHAKQLFELFFVFLKIGGFTLGGGFAMIPLIERELVDDRHWLSEQEFLDWIAVAQSVPGAIAVNTAALTGNKIDGWVGSSVATLGVMIPSFTIITFIAIFLTSFANLAVVQAVFKAIRPVVVALIVYAAFNLSKALRPNQFNVLIGLSSLFSLVVLQMSPVFVIVLAITFGVLRRALPHGHSS